MSGISARGTTNVPRSAPDPATDAPALPTGSVPLFSLFDGVLLLSLLFYLATTLSYLGQPLLGQHSFRQCQTAISVPWLAADLDPRRMFVYETPILGAPWRVPFEFPLYQWLAAVVVRLTSWRVEVCCRIVATAFYLACLWPLWRIVRAGGGTVRLWKILASLFLLAPVLHHWSRTALIETTAVYMALEYLAAMVAWTRWRSPWSLVVAVMFAVLAVLVKVTTFPPFAVAAGIACLLGEWPVFRQDRRLAPAVVRLVVAAVPLVVALACLVPWLEASDAVKRLNPIAASTTSAALGDWNYGTLAQKISGQLWIGTIFLRAIPEAIGWPGLLMLVGGAFAAGMHTRIVAGTLAGLFLLPFLLFTNLHIVHDYYQTANAVWLVAALAVVLDRVCDMVPPPAAVGLVVLCLGGQVQQSMARYLPMEQVDFAPDVRLAVARRLREVVPPNDVVVYVGCDWSPEIAFYSGHRAIYVPQWVSYDDVMKIVSDPDAISGGRRVGAAVLWNNSPCVAGDPRWDPRTTEPLVKWAQAIAAGRDPVQVGTFILFERTAGPAVTSAPAN